MVKLKELLEQLKIKYEKKDFTQELLNINIEENINNFKHYTKTTNTITIEGEENISTQPKKKVIKKIQIIIQPQDKTETLIITSEIKNNFKQYISYNKNGGKSIIS